MSRSLLKRIEALEQAAGIGKNTLVVILSSFTGGDQIAGYSWSGGELYRKPGESESDLLDRAKTKGRD